MKGHAAQDDRANGHDDNGLLHQLEQEPHVMPEWVAQAPAWLRNPLQKARGLSLMVTKKTGGTFTVRDWIGGGLLAACLTFTANLYWKRQDEHDELIKLRTVVEITEKTNAERDLRIETARNFATIADKNVTRLEGKIDQFMQIYSIKNADKAKLTYERE
jgi:hypothetical protein